MAIAHLAGSLAVALWRSSFFGQPRRVDLLACRVAAPGSASLLIHPHWPGSLRIPHRASRAHFSPE
jgi:hypothetical protein